MGFMEWLAEKADDVTAYRNANVAKQKDGTAWYHQAAEGLGALGDRISETNDSFASAADRAYKAGTEYIQPAAEYVADKYDAMQAHRAAGVAERERANQIANEQRRATELAARNRGELPKDALEEQTLSALMATKALMPAFKAIPTKQLSTPTGDIFATAHKRAMAEQARREGLGEMAAINRAVRAQNGKGWDSSLSNTKANPNIAEGVVNTFFKNKNKLSHPARS